MKMRIMVGDGLSFDDSEDERAPGLDDCFEDHGWSSRVNINYASEELSCSDPDASDEEKDPKYPWFKIEDSNKNYKFKVGLEFVSLDEFKEAITK
ncbi:hypothetical protein KIW84_056929 [Lathyrus oleraceus]|uniref:Uncharacterized protein n=1 Tax=Pisum sativum TaxID=3888 RepID=A0A9D4X278_PEA|nr:hypothetical protein KIW84_056929 [Pisum sativum]